MLRSRTPFFQRRSQILFKKNFFRTAALQCKGCFASNATLCSCRVAKAMQGVREKVGGLFYCLSNSSSSAQLM